MEDEIGLGVDVSLLLRPPIWIVGLAAAVAGQLLADLGASWDILPQVQNTTLIEVNDVTKA
jgi:hypothetical protein